MINEYKYKYHYISLAWGSMHIA